MTSQPKAAGKGAHPRRRRSQYHWRKEVPETQGSILRNLSLNMVIKRCFWKVGIAYLDVSD
jgi:hypothetical protein